MPPQRQRTARAPPSVSWKQPSALNRPATAVVQRHHKNGIYKSISLSLLRHAHTLVPSAFCVYILKVCRHKITVRRVDTVLIHRRLRPSGQRGGRTSTLLMHGYKLCALWRCRRSEKTCHTLLSIKLLMFVLAEIGEREDVDCFCSESESLMA